MSAPHLGAAAAADIAVSTRVVHADVCGIDDRKRTKSLVNALPGLADFADAGGGSTVSSAVNTGTAASSRSASPLRWFMLLMGVVILIGPYVAFDSPAGTQVTLRGWMGTPEEPPNINSTLAYNSSYSAFNAN